MKKEVYVKVLSLRSIDGARLSAADMAALRQ